MSYVNCPRCRVAIRLRMDALAPEHCPRCAARDGVRSKLFESKAPSRLLEMATAVTNASHNGSAALSRPPA